VKELRAIVLGLLVVVLVMIGISLWRRPSRELKHLRGFKVEIQKSEGGERRRHISFHVPISLIARLTTLVPFQDFGGDFRTDWGHGDLSAKDILDAADRSAPGQPGEIKRDHNTITVAADGVALDIVVNDDCDKTVRMRIPRSLVESLSSEKSITPREILRKLDELGPGDVVVINDRDDQLTITAEPR
jgi:hypothetical protein